MLFPLTQSMAQEIMLLIGKLLALIIGTSANISGQPNVLTAKEVEAS